MTKPLPDRLITELTAHRTLALRDALAENPAIAFQAVLHNFVLMAFYRFASSGSCSSISDFARRPFPLRLSGLREAPLRKPSRRGMSSWKARLPKSENDLRDALTALDGGAQASLFAHCASFAANALYAPANRYNQGRVSAHGVRTRLDQADVLARAVGLDMVQAGWRPTVDNYLGRVTKPRILEAVREAKGELSAQLIDHLKKADMAKEAERLLEASGWLPEPLRPVDAKAAPASRRVKPGRCLSSLPTTRTEKTPATTTRPSSTRLSDFLIAGRLRLSRTLWGPAHSAGPLFMGRQRGRGGPGRV